MIVRWYIFGLFLIFSLVLMIVYGFPTIRKVKEKSVDYTGHIYAPDMIPAAIVFIFLFSFVIEQLSLVDTVWGIFFPILFDLSTYFLVCILILPLLRKRVSGKFCAAVWILPNIMYLFAYPSYRPVPDIIVSVGRYAEVLAWVWGAGFVLVLGMHIASHLKFRSRLLENSVYVEDERVLEIWKEELDFSKVNQNEKLLQISSQVKAPLTIGLFKRSTVLLLPHLNYTEEQLRVIFRHELVHLNKRDNASKYFMVFCNAICWFNPLMWKAMKLCAEDMERSCDEAVLYDADESERKQYAELILDTCAESKGFSTCLSASSNSLRYRLKRIVHPVKSRLEGLILALLLLSMAWFGGRVAFSYESGPMTAIRLDEEKSILKIDGIYKEDHLLWLDISERFEIDRPEQFLEYLSTLKTETMSWVYSYSMQSELSMAVVFEDTRVSLEIKEIDDGLLIKEQYRPEKMDVVYLVRGVTLEEFVSHLN